MEFNKKEFESVSRRGNSHKHAKRTIVNAILYVVKGGGIQWRLMPNDFPPWQTVYDHFSRWNKHGVWERALDQVTADRRKKAGRATSPTYGIIDAQSLKTQYDSEERGIDGGKKVRSCLAKRFLNLASVNLSAF